MIAALICDIAGPLHPGEATRANDPFTRRAGLLASELIAAIAAPVVALRDAQRHDRQDDRQGQQDQQARRGGQAGDAAAASSENALRIDVSDLRARIERWIETGSDRPVNDSGQPTGAPDIPSASATCSQAQAIASFLAAQAGHQVASSEASWLRLAVLAQTAPAVQSLVVMCALEEGFIATLVEPDEREADLHARVLARSVVARTVVDDADVAEASDSLAGQSSARAPATLAAAPTAAALATESV